LHPGTKRLTPHRPKILDLFCGAGGFCLGARTAGFDSALSVDIDENLTSSFTENFPNSKLLLADITQIGVSEILRLAGVQRGEIDGVIGGPPCQGFSLIGKREHNDPRNALICHFFRIVQELKPRFFVMENVPGLLLGNARSTLEDGIANLTGFEIVGPIVIDAWDFGAATRRERVVVLGYDRKHVQCVTKTDIRRAKARKKHSVRDAISDLPEPANCHWLPYKHKQDSELTSYARRARLKPQLGLGSAASRQKLEQKQVSGVRVTTHTDEVVDRFREVDPGKTDRISRCPRLTWSEPAPTLRAGTGPDKGSFQSIRPIHPRADRVITVREAARLQGFPDWFQFHETKWHSFRMIGNSVSPLLSAALLKLIANRLEC
jgi:DNA (cytosine-5)-methyltransferase 1